MSDTRRRGLLIIATAMIVYLSLMVVGISSAAAEEAPGSRCDISASRQGASVTVTHLSPLPSPGNVTINGVLYRSSDWQGDGAGNMVIVATVPANEPAVVHRYLPPPGGECTITLPAERESKWDRWRDRLDRWHAERAAWRDRWLDHRSDRCCSRWSR